VHGRISNLVGAAHLEPGARNPNAILIVQRLADPLPHRLAPTADAIVPSADWERAAQRALADCFDRAARPIDGAVPASANAVRFDDEAQLLACLARDFLAGDAPARWWWRALFRHAASDARAMTIAAWLERPRAVPAALASLAATGEAVAFVRALSNAQAVALLVAIAEAYALPAIASIAAMPTGAAATAFAARASSIAHADVTSPPPTDVDVPVAAVPPAPWRLLVDSAAAPTALDVDRQALLGIALVVARSPLAVRAPRFARDFRDWRQAVHARAPHSAPAAASLNSSAGAPTLVTSRLHVGEIAPAARTSTITAATQAHPISAPVTVGESPSRGSNGPAGDVASATEPLVASIATDDSVAGAAEIRRAADADDGRSGPTAGESDRAAIVRSRGDDGAIARPAAHRRNAGADGQRGDVPPSASIPPPPPAIRTAAASTIATDFGGVLFLVNAFDDERLFERIVEMQPDSRIGAWQWLGLVGRRLLGDAGDVDADPIWSALAMLDGERADDRDADAILDAIVPPLGERLVRALGLEGAFADARVPLAHRLLHRQASLSCTATHVDLHMTLAQIDIAVRLCGLDANPGWVPSLGRVVTFYFE